MAKKKTTTNGKQTTLAPVQDTAAPQYQRPAASFDLMERLFDRFFDERPFSLFPRLNTGFNWQPQVDVKETDREIIVSASIPGVDKKDLSVELHDGVLTIRGERRETNEDKTKGYVRREQSYGSFYRAFTLPAGVKADAIKATHKNGVTEITIPKTKETTPETRKLTIQ